MSMPRRAFRGQSASELSANEDADGMCDAFFEGHYVLARVLEPATVH